MFKHAFFHAAVSSDHQIYCPHILLTNDGQQIREITGSNHYKITIPVRYTPTMVSAVLQYNEVEQNVLLDLIYFKATSVSKDDEKIPTKHMHVYT
jgi:hypothetical protein